MVEHSAPVPGRFRDYVAERVRRGVERGLISRDSDSGLAVAEAGPQPQGVPADVAAQCRDPRFMAWIEDIREVEDLRYMLREGEAHAVALKALGVTVVEAPVLTSFAARVFAPLVSLAAHGVPESRREDSESLLTAMLRVRMPLTRWQWALVNLFEVLWPGIALRHKRPKERVEACLEVLRGSVDDLPRNLREPRPDHLEKAARVTQHLKVTHAKAGRTTVSPWGAAQRFAKAFGVPFPRNRFEAERDHKAEQARRESKRATHALMGASSGLKRRRGAQRNTGSRAKNRTDR